MPKQEHPVEHARSPEPNRGEKGQQGMQPREQAAPTQRAPYGTSPFSLMRRFSEDVDRLFGNFFGSSSMWRDEWPGWSSDMAAATFWPSIDVKHVGNKLLIQADVPGLKREDLKVEVRDRELCISGERRSESEHEEGRIYRTERTYGSFYRAVALPDGAKPDTASATFENGVLKIELEAPGAAPSQGRRIEVREGSPH